MKLIEGIGDEYLKRKYKGRIIDDFDDFEEKYKYMKLKEKECNVIYEREDGWKIIKNPISLENIGKKARGIILLNGDLYLETFSKGTIHNYILSILYNLKIIKEDPGKNWGRKLPQETGFLTIQRYKESSWIAIGESNKIIYEESDWKSLKEKYEEVLEKARIKNPNLNFSNKLVGVKLQAMKKFRKDNKYSYDHALKENLIKYFI